MNIEKVKEIKEKLKERYYYLDQAYSDHLAYGGKADEQQEEEIYFLGDIRTLINELESENERLTKELDSEWKDRRKAEEDLHKAQWKYKIGLAQSRKRNKELKDRIAELEKENGEQLKQFAERLKDKCNDKNAFMCSNSITATDIDETLKEFINKGDDN